MSPKSYKIFFITLLMVGGFLFLAANQAKATCICNDTAPFDHSAVTYQDYCENICSNVGGVKTWSPPRSGTCTFDSDCGQGETCTADGCMPGCNGGPACNSGETCTADGCMASCNGGPACNSGETCTADGCMPSGGTATDTDACGGNCRSGYYCDPTGSEGGTAACLPFNDENSRSGAPQANCREVCDQTGCRTVCDSGSATGGGGSSGSGLPGAGSGLPGAGAASGGSGSVQLPNFLGSGVTSIKDLIFKIVAFLIDIAKYFAALMLVWAGFLFVTAQGDPAKLTKAKQNFLWTVAGIAVILASDAIVTYIMEVLGVTGAGAGSALMTKIKATLTQVVALLFVLVTLYFCWGIVEFVRASASGDSAKLEAGKKHMIWGIVGMAVMLGAWGIVEMIRVFFL